MTGAHHYNVDGQIDGTVAGADATDPASSYRFLNGLYGRKTSTGRTPSPAATTTITSV